MPTGKSTAVRMFGKTDALNVVSEEYGYNDKLIGLYIFAATDNTKSGEKPADKTDSSAADSSATESSSAADSSSQAEDSSSEVEKAAASVIGAGTLTLSCAGSAAVGALIAFLIVRKKKDDKAA